LVSKLTRFTRLFLLPAASLLVTSTNIWTHKALAKLSTRLPARLVAADSTDRGAAGRAIARPRAASCAPPMLERPPWRTRGARLPISRRGNTPFGTFTTSRAACYASASPRPSSPKNRARADRLDVRFTPQLVIWGGAAEDLKRSETIRNGQCNNLLHESRYRARWKCRRS
jgi:hypothetical protein